MIKSHFASVVATSLWGLLFLRAYGLRTMHYAVATGTIAGK